MKSEKKKPIFSIITVTFNSEKTVKDTIESVLHQTCGDFEYIIVDGRSKDRTVEIIRSYEKKFKGKLKWVSEKDSGIYDAMNKAIGMASGKYIGIINSDDWYENDALEITLKAFRKSKSDITYGILRLFRNGKVLSLESHSHEFLNESMIMHPTCFIKKEIYDKFGTFDKQYRSAADYDFILRLFKGGAKFHHIDKVLANFRIGGMSYGFQSRYETNLIKYRYGFLSRAAYFKKLLRLYLKI